MPVPIIGDGLSALTDPYTYDAYGNMRDTEDGNGQPFHYQAVTIDLYSRQVVFLRRSRLSSS
ncbi:hypothetical protein [Kordiimonas sp.]|uniref:hypothetical protein n=1 Tax=Kordiimonas sp. TaxID=1970157 RepID=UPI003B51EC1A